MSTRFKPGDFLVFQLEAGYGLLRLLEIESNETDTIWHVAGYDDFFLDVETAETMSADHTKLTSKNAHMALSNRAFESTQVATISNVPLTAEELEPIANWRSVPDRTVSDRSVRLMLGLR
ncbi:MAG: hypothetical protein ABL959_24870 [Pyrinomonadaceae bacterium]